MPDRPQLAAANAALDACAALFRAQNGDRDRQRQARRLENKLEKELERLTALTSWIESTMGPLAGDPKQKPDIGSQAAARAITRCAEKAVAEQHKALEREHQRQLDRLARGFDGRSLRLALDRFFSHFEISDTQWQLRWRRGRDGEMPTAKLVARSPIEVEAEFGLALPPGEPWWQPTRLDALAPPPREARLHTGDGKPVPPGKFWLMELEWEAGTGSMVLSRSRKKATGMARVAFPGDGVALVTAVDEHNNAMGAATAQDPTTNEMLQHVWNRLSAAVAELVAARGDATSLRFEGSEIEKIESPGRMGVAILSAMRPQLRELRDQLDDQPEVLARLRDKFSELPERYRAMLDRAGLGDAAAGVEVDIDIDFDDESLPTQPFIEAEEDEEEPPMFGSSTLDETFDRLSGPKTNAEKTLPGYRPAPVGV